ncbi:MAG TPA: GNAT family N-acetyltransferase [Pyrinomonadaceae bacterium]|nr:GNAT family N-acetyltransferase [Pyrinomonadaceae bacterium]
METERLVLKLYTEKDKSDFVNLFTDRIVMKHVGDGVMTIEQTENLWRKLFEKLYAENLETIWAVFALCDSRYVGHASLRPRPTKPEDWEIGYVLKENEWGKGFATEIARRLIELGFDELNLPEVYATVDDDNFPSIHVLEKTGMSFHEFDYDEQGKYSVYSIKKR